MKVLLTLWIISLQTIYVSCQNTGANIIVKPATFKIAIPFKINNRGIIIDTYWGASKTRNELLWDNNSPTWANEKVIADNKSISVSKKFFYSTTTADGTPIHGRIYNSDSISLGTITFTNVPFYEINDELNGALGDNMISKGVWEINFRNKEITFASTVDSLKGIDSAELFPAKFTDNGIKLAISFSNNINEDVDIDLGFDGFILLPDADFFKIATCNKCVYADSLRFSTPGSNRLVQSYHISDFITIGANKFATKIYNNKLVREKLIGLRFFETFDFVIFDYRNKLFYVSKKRQ